MNLALLGDHPDGLDMALALVGSGRHQLLSYSGSPFGEQFLRRQYSEFSVFGDIEEILADPVIDAVIVAGTTGQRFAQLRRALQAEKHVLSVHPLDQSPDAAYEAALLEKERGCLLFPLLPEMIHPALEQLRILIATDRARLSKNGTGQSSPRLVQVQRRSCESTYLDTKAIGHLPGFPGWEVLRALGGEIVEVSAFGNWLEIVPNEPLVVTGCFAGGGIFQTTFLPEQAQDDLSLTVLFGNSRAELQSSDNWRGPGVFRWHDESGNPQEETWDQWNPWTGLVEAFERHWHRHIAKQNGAAPVDEESMQTATPTWLDESRSLELDEAARRSLAKRRSSVLEFQESFEEASFKGTMTLVGCGLLWGSVLLLILSLFVPFLAWLILPLFAIFLFLQILRWLVLPARNDSPANTPEDSKPG